MSRKSELKSRDKLVNKMTRDGLATRNLASGDDTRVSKREADTNLRSAAAEREGFSNTGKSYTKRTTQEKAYRHKKNEYADSANKYNMAEIPGAALPAQNGGGRSESLSPAEISKPVQTDGNGSAPSKLPNPKSNQKRINTWQYRQNEKRQAVNADFPAKDKVTDKPADTAVNTQSVTKTQDSRSGIESLRKPQSRPKEAAPGASKKYQSRKLRNNRIQADFTARKFEIAKLKPHGIDIQRSGGAPEKKSKGMKRRIYFESTVKSNTEPFKGPLPLRAVKTTGKSALVLGHSKMFQAERENVGVEAVHKGEMIVEAGARTALRFQRNESFQKAAKTELKTAKKSVNMAYSQTLAKDPKLKSNLLSRMWQRRKIKKDYAKAAREAQNTAKRAKRAGAAAFDAGKFIIKSVSRHPAAIGITVLILILLFALMSIIGMLSSLFSGGMGAVLTASYLADDADIERAELTYTCWETDLKSQIANTERSHTGYDEYRYSIGEISHNAYELMAYLTVKYQNFAYDDISAALYALFLEQYTLTFTPSSETRYADPNDADDDGDYEPYRYEILTVTLTSRPLNEVILSHLSDEEYAYYELLVSTKGYRQYLANPFGFDWLPYVTSNYGYRIHPIQGGTNIHRGVDIGVPKGTEIHSGQDGIVTFAGRSGDYGNVVVIDNGKGLVSKYAHCETLLAVSGEPVKTGDIIATVGSTGNSTGPHLHLEVLINGQYINPLYATDSGRIS